MLTLVLMAEIILLLEFRQWGVISVKNGVNFDFPIAFKKRCVFASAVHYGTTTGITFNVDCMNSVTNGHIYTNYDKQDPVWTYFYVVGY